MVPVYFTSDQGLSLAVSGCASHLTSVAISACNTRQNLLAMNFPMMFLENQLRTDAKPSLSPHMQGVMKVKNRTLASLSTQSLNGVTYELAIQLGPWPDSLITQSTWIPLDAYV